MNAYRTTHCDMPGDGNAAGGPGKRPSGRARMVAAGLAVALAVGACTPAAAPTYVAPPPSEAPTVDVAATLAAQATQINAQALTSVAATVAAMPTQTQLPTQTPLPTPTPPPTATPTRVPSATATVAPTATATVAPTKKAVVAQAQPVVATQAPAATKAPPSIYGYTATGPRGYTSTLYCTRGDGSQCQPVMPAGDLSFSIVLKADDNALRAIFYPFGLSVERDGANVADMFMTVGAGWLDPGQSARLGTSRKFDVPGHYVVRSSGCLITEDTVGDCSWSTVTGSSLIFQIQ